MSSLRLSGSTIAFRLATAWLKTWVTYRGIIVTYKTLREWAEKFGRAYADTIRRRMPCLGDKSHLDDCAISIKGEHHILWRAVDQHGFVLDVLAQKRRSTKAAEPFMRKVLSGQGASPRVIITDKLRSHRTAKRQLGLCVFEHRQHKGLNNRAENSHQPLRRREQIMKRFKSTRHFQRFASIGDLIYNHQDQPRGNFCANEPSTSCVALHGNCNR